MVVSSGPGASASSQQPADFRKGMHGMGMGGGRPGTSSGREMESQDARMNIMEWNIMPNSGGQHPLFFN
jgi:hypothetical protein